MSVELHFSGRCFVLLYRFFVITDEAHDSQFRLGFRHNAVVSSEMPDTALRLASGAFHL